MKNFLLRRFVLICISFILCIVFLLLSFGCTRGEDDGIMNIQTILALTPTNTPTLTPSPTKTPTMPPTPTPTLTPTPSPVPTATPTPLPPTPTPNPALKGFSFCTQDFGERTNGRFSAHTTGVITAEVFPAFERLGADFALDQDSAPLSAQATLVDEHDFRMLTGEPAAPAPYVLMIHLNHWLHDEAFLSSVMTTTKEFTKTGVIRTVDFLYDADKTAGATMLVALENPTLYRLDMSRDRPQLRVEVARADEMPPLYDEMTLASGKGRVKPPDPLYFLLQGDMWRLDSSGVISLTQSPEEETDLAVNRDGSLIAFCRTQEPGINPSESSLAVPGTLWLMQSDGTHARRIPDTGVNCEDPAFSPDGSRIAFSVDETGTYPEQRTIKIVAIETEAITDTHSITETDDVQATDVMTATHMLATDDDMQLVMAGNGWNRFGPQWVDDTMLVYAANATDGRSTLFLLDVATKMEYDIGADLKVDGEQFRYHALGRPVVSRDGRMIAVEALRADDTGTDLLLLDSTGQQKEVINQGYWSRPLAFTDAGGLYFLTTQCEGTLVQAYELHLYDSDGKDRLLATGETYGTIGESVTLDDVLVYVVTSRALPGPRGPNTASPYSSSELWLWDVGKVRGEVFSSQWGITKLAR